VGRAGSSSPWVGEGGRITRRAARTGTAVAVVTFALLATGGRLWRLFDRGPFSSDFYDAQARALSRGHLAVDPAVASIEGFAHGGAIHFYYGIVPALARLPVSAVTQGLDGRLVLVSLLGGVTVGCLAAARLLQRARLALGIELSPAAWSWLTGVFAAAVGISTPLLWLSSRALVYHEAELWGAALAILGFERVVAWWSSRRDVDLAWASGAAALALGTRGSSGMGPAVALGGLAVVLAWRRAWRPATTVALAASVPVLLYAAVNAARFGTPFSVPFDAQVLNAFSPPRRAALADNGGTLFGLKFVPTGALQYLRPDTVAPRALFPWISWGGRADVVGDVTFDTIDRSASLPVAAPAFVVAWAVGVVAVIRRRLPASWVAALVAGAAAVGPTLAIAFIAQRYLADFVPGLVVGASVGVPVVAAWAVGSARRVRWSIVGAAALLLLGLSVNAGLGLLARYVYLLPAGDERRGFVTAQYDLHDALGGGRPPDVVELTQLGAPRADGTVAVLGDCDGLYRSEGTEWVALELRPGGSRRVVVEGSAVGPVVSGDGWRILLERDGAGRRLVYEGTDRIEGRPLDATGAVTVDVRLLPETATVQADVDGARSLDVFAQPTGGPLEAASGWTERPGEAALCTSLRERLG
jgi:hypothetical protein